MKKLLLVVGIAVGFVLGSRQGREPYERLEAQVRQLAGRPEAKGAMHAASDKAAELADTVAGAVTEKIGHGTAAAKHAFGSASGPDAAKGPPGSIDQSDETEAVLDHDLEASFPTSDPPSSWAGPDIEPERPESTAPPPG